MKKFMRLMSRSPKKVFGKVNTTKKPNSIPLKLRQKVGAKMEKTLKEVTRI